MSVQFRPGFCHVDSQTTYPDAWMGIGEYGSLPYDNEVIGSGEVEGKIVTPEDAAGREPGLEGFINEIWGKDASVLVAKLNAVTGVEPAPRDTGRPKAPC